MRNIYGGDAKFKAQLARVLSKTTAGHRYDARQVGPAVIGGGSGDYTRKGWTVYQCSSLLLYQVGEIVQRVVWQRLTRIETRGGSMYLSSGLPLGASRRGDLGGS